MGSEPVIHELVGEGTENVRTLPIEDGPVPTADFLTTADPPEQLLLDAHLRWVRGEDFAEQPRGQVRMRLVLVVVLINSSEPSLVER